VRRRLRSAFVSEDVQLCDFLRPSGGSDRALAHALMTGKTIGKYRVLGHAGRGAMGTVYKALDATLNREVAIKILNSGRTDPDSLTRFRAEATTLATLNHPAIATIYELFEHDDDLLIVMEFVLGETLESFTARVGPLDPAQAVFIVDRVLSALAHTHRAGIVHCDIKPANVMVTTEGAVKTMDFGTARVRGATPGEVSGYVMGTPAYMPPEQLLGRPIDERTDLYAVGVLFYRLVTGTLPFAAETAIDAMRKQVTDAPARASQHRPDLPDWCDYIVTRALAKDPSDRFQTADGFRDALRYASRFVAADVRRLFSAVVVDAPAVLPSAFVVNTGSTAHVAPGAWLVRTPPHHRPQAARRFALFVPAVASLLTVATLRAPSSSGAEPAPSAPAPSLSPVAIAPPIEPEPDRTTRVRTPLVYAFEARVVAGDQTSQQECKCRVVLADGRMSWRDQGDRRRVDAIAYDRVASMVYSHGRDPLWNGSGGPTPVVRVRRSPLGLLGISSERDWLSIRVTDRPNLRFVVLRFEDVAQARSAIDALEERIGVRIERLSKRQS
jgi:hypothetical protein